MPELVSARPKCLYASTSSVGKVLGPVEAQLVGQPSVSDGKKLMEKRREKHKRKIKEKER